MAPKPTFGDGSTSSSSASDKQTPSRVFRPKVDKAFTEFWLAYPRKKAKGAAEKAWAKIRPDEQLHNRILDAIGLSVLPVCTQFAIIHAHMIALLDGPAATIEPLPADIADGQFFTDRPPNMMFTAQHTRRSQRPFAFFHLEHFQIIARLDVVGVGEQHAAFHARAHFGGIVLEPAQ